MELHQRCYEGAMLNPKSFRFEVKEGVGVVTFARPDTLNSLTFEVYRELTRALLELEKIARGQSGGDHRRGQGLLLGRRRQLHHRRALLARHAGAGRLHPHDLRPDQEHARAAQAGGGGAQRHGGRSGRGDRAGGRPAGGEREGEDRLPLRQGGPRRRRHGRGVPAAQGGGAVERDRAALLRRHGRRGDRRALRPLQQGGAAREAVRRGAGLGEAAGAGAHLRARA